MSDTIDLSHTSTTLDPPTSVLLSLRRDGKDYHVTDTVGLRYGHSSEPLLALIEWWWQVRDLLDIEEPTGGELAMEIDRYRRALAVSPADTTEAA